ncbi:hypothetical protein [Mycolicibacterium nivoides]|uniref:Uncharacterized protein n=1 Tax=Mycolicibacterium nivoides TaxID=2487344 RepID=A0ABW9LKB5_9MYCO
MHSDDEFVSLDEALAGVSPDDHPTTCGGSGQAPAAESDEFGVCLVCRTPYPVLINGLLPTHPTGIPWQNVDDVWRAYNNDL